MTVNGLKKPSHPRGLLFCVFAVRPLLFLPPSLLLRVPRRLPAPPVPACGSPTPLSMSTSSSHGFPALPSPPPVPHRSRRHRAEFFPPAAHIVSSRRKIERYGQGILYCDGFFGGDQALLLPFQDLDVAHPRGGGGGSLSDRAQRPAAPLLLHGGSAHRALAQSRGMRRTRRRPPPERADHRLPRHRARHLGGDVRGLSRPPSPPWRAVCG